MTQPNSSAKIDGTSPAHSCMPGRDCCADDATCDNAQPMEGMLEEYILPLDLRQQKVPIFFDERTSFTLVREERRIVLPEADSRSAWESLRNFGGCIFQKIDALIDAMKSGQ